MERSVTFACRALDQSTQCGHVWVELVLMSEHVAASVEEAIKKGSRFFRFRASPVCSRKISRESVSFSLHSLLQVSEWFPATLGTHLSWARAEVLVTPITCKQSTWRNLQSPNNSKYKCNCNEFMFLLPRAHENTRSCLWDSIKWTWNCPRYRQSGEREWLNARPKTDSD